MRFSEIINEGAELYCPNCHDFMGKARENDENARCSNCGEQFKNIGGIRRSKIPDVKFGRLVLTDLENEEGCVQGVLKTAKGDILGRVTRYGPSWHDYDDGRLEAYCQATKSRKKGFPDQKKAVEWIVRQTRASVKQKAAESRGLSEGESGGNVYVLGHVIPDWEVEADQGYAAMFRGDPMYQPVQVTYEGGRFEVVFSTEDRDFYDSPEAVEVVLKKNGYTTYEGWDDFSPQSPHD